MCPVEHSPRETYPGTAQKHAKPFPHPMTLALIDDIPGPVSSESE